MKLAVLGLIIVGMYFIYQATVGNAFALYDECYQSTSTKIEQLSTSLSTVCVEEKLAFDELNYCVREVQRENNFYSFLYQAAPARKNIETAIETHNEACVSNQVDPPKDSFYL